MKNYTWHRIAESLETSGLTEKSITSLTVGGKNICIARYQDKLYGCAQKCPHASGLMSQGRVDEQGEIICPLHRYRFNLQNGRNSSGEGYYLKPTP